MKLEADTEEYKDINLVFLKIYYPQSQRPPCRQKDPVGPLLAHEFIPVKNAFALNSKDKVEKKLPISYNFYNIFRPPSRHKTPTKGKIKNNNFSIGT